MPGAGNGGEMDPHIKGSGSMLASHSEYVVVRLEDLPKWFQTRL